MTTVYNKTTELEAINIILNRVGSASVSTIPTSGDSDAAMCKRAFDQQMRELLSRGMNFNKIRNQRFVPDVNNQIKVPSNTLSVWSNKWNGNYTVRDNVLWDVEANTSNFVTYRDLNLSISLDFEDIPQEHRTYILEATSVELADQMNLDEPRIARYERKKQIAYAGMLRADMRYSKKNYLSCYHGTAIISQAYREQAYGRRE